MVTGAGVPDWRNCWKDGAEMRHETHCPKCGRMTGYCDCWGAACPERFPIAKEHARYCEKCSKEAMPTCPTCGCPCRVVSDKEGTSYYTPESPQVGQLIKTLVAQQEDELRILLSCRPGESVVEAAKRWRETMEWYGDATNYDIHDEEGWYRTGGTLAERDGGQRARECIGD